MLAFPLDKRFHNRVPNVPNLGSGRGGPVCLGRCAALTLEMGHF